MKADLFDYIHGRPYGTWKFESLPLVGDSVFVRGESNTVLHRQFDLVNKRVLLSVTNHGGKCNAKMSCGPRQE